MAQQSAASKRARTPKNGDDVGRRGRPRKAQNEVTSDLIATGLATMAQLAGLFRTDAKTLPQRLKSLPPEGNNRSGYRAYSIRKAAALLVEPGYEIEEFIRQMSPQELPPLLLKEYWNGQNARLKYERELGNLWPTEDIVEFVGELLATIRMTILLVADDVNREESLTDGQREIIQRIMDGLINTLREKIAEKFRAYHANRPVSSNSEPIEHQVSSSYGPDDIDLDEDDDPLTAEGDEDDLLAAEDDEEDDLGI